MHLTTEVGHDKILFISENLDSSDLEKPFNSKSSINVVRTSILSLGLSPYLLEVTNDSTEDLLLSDEDKNTIYNFIKTHKITRVIALGKSIVTNLFPSISKGTTMAKLVNSPMLTPIELDVKVGVLNHAFGVYKNSNTNSDAIPDFIQKLDSLFSFKHQVKVNVTKIVSDEEFIDLLSYLSSTNSPIGLDYETNAEDPFNKNHYLTMVGLSEFISKDLANSWYYIPNKSWSNLVLEAYTKFVTKNDYRIWTYNCAFEIKCTWHLTGKYCKFQDAMVLATIHANRGSLKNIIRETYGTLMWEQPVQEFKHNSEVLVSKIKNKPSLVELCKSGNYKELQLLDESKEYVNWMIDNYEESEVAEALTHYPYEWAMIPKDTLGVYCAQDAGYTVLLADKLNTEEFKWAYSYYIKHPWLAAKFEVNGINWDDNKAKEISDDLITQQIDLLYKIVQECDITMESKLEATALYHKELPFDIIWYTEKTKKERIKKIITPNDKLEEMKNFFNPASNTADSRKKFWNSYNNDTINLGGILILFLENFELTTGLDKLYKVIGDKSYVYSNTPQDVLAKILESAEKDKSINNSIKKSLSFAVESMEENTGKFAGPVIKFHYQIHKQFLKLDISKPETWSREFSMLFNIFYYKKLNKVNTTNILGSTGRASVYENIGSIHGKTLRGSLWGNIPVSEHKDKKWILNTSFNSLSAATNRWSSGFHTIPPSSPARHCLKCDNEDELFIHCDFSQAELVTMALMADDDEMKQAFLDGLDMHQFVASKMFNIEFDKVTKDQRKAAKACFTGDTLVRLLDGTSVPIKDLDNYIGKYTYGCTVEGEIVPAKITNHMLAKQVTKLLKITIDNGTSYQCTEDHKWMLRDGSYCEAKDLVEGTSLMPLYSRVETEGRYSGYEIIEDGFKDNITHIRVRKYGDIGTFGYSDDKPSHTHHINEIKLNNDPSNLLKISPSDHARIHSKTMISNRDSSNYRIGNVRENVVDYLRSVGAYDDRTKVSAMMTEESKDFLNSRNYVGFIGNILKYINSLLKNNLEVNINNWNTYKPVGTFINYENIKLHTKLSIEELIDMAKSRDIYEDYKIIKYSDSESKQKLSDRALTRMNSLWLDKDFRDKISRGVSKNIAIRNKCNTLKISQQRGKILRAIKSYVDLGFEFNTVFDMDKFIKDVQINTNTNNYSINHKKILKYVGDITTFELYNLGKHYNHKVKSVEIINLDTPINVYDIETSTGNFAIGNRESSVIVSNCNFGLLFGKTVENLAVDITDGDVEKAQEFMDLVLGKFPGIRKFISSKHKQLSDVGYVTNHFGAHLAIDLSLPGNGAARAGQNYPIQSTSNIVAGTSMYDFTEECENKSIYEKAVGFTHDALDSITKVDQLFDYINSMIYQMQTKIYDDLKMPMKIDIEIGVDSFNACKFSIKDSHENMRVIEIEGEETATSQLIDKLKMSKTYEVVYIEEVKTKTDDNTFEEMLTTGTAFKSYWGKSITKKVIELGILIK